MSVISDLIEQAKADLTMARLNQALDAIVNAADALHINHLSLVASLAALEAKVNALAPAVVKKVEDIAEKVIPVVKADVAEVVAEVKAEVAKVAPKKATPPKKG